MGWIVMIVLALVGIFVLLVMCGVDEVRMQAQKRGFEEGRRYEALLCHTGKLSFEQRPLSTKEEIELVQLRHMYTGRLF